MIDIATLWYESLGEVFAARGDHLQWSWSPGLVAGGSGARQGSQFIAGCWANVLAPLPPIWLIKRHGTLLGGWMGDNWERNGSCHPSAPVLPQQASGRSHGTYPCTTWVDPCPEVHVSWQGKGWIWTHVDPTMSILRGAHQRLYPDRQTFETIGVYTKRPKYTATSLKRAAPLVKHSP